MPRKRRSVPSAIPPLPSPFDPTAELNWGAAVYGRRLLREHLDQTHDSASRRTKVIAGHVRRLRRLLPDPPARLLDAGCGPGLYALRLAALGHDVVGVDVDRAALSHARVLTRKRRPGGRVTFRTADLRDLDLPAERFDAALLIYFVLENFPRRQQPGVLRGLRRALKPGGRVIAELRLRPDRPPGRSDWWDIVPNSLLSDHPHLLLGDSVFDTRRNTFVLREVAVFDDGTTAVLQTSGWLCPFESIPNLFARGGFRVDVIHDGWSSRRATALSETVLVVATATG